MHVIVNGKFANNKTIPISSFAHDTLNNENTLRRENKLSDRQREFEDALKLTLGASISLLEEEIKRYNGTDESRYMRHFMNELFLNQENQLKGSDDIDTTIGNLMHFGDALKSLKKILSAGKCIFNDDEDSSIMRPTNEPNEIVDQGDDIIRSGNHWVGTMRPTNNPQPLVDQGDDIIRNPTVNPDTDSDSDLYATNPPPRHALNR